MSSNPKQRLTLTNLNEPQQMRELNRQMSWIWDQLLGGLSMKSLSGEARKVIDSKAESGTVDELGRTVSSHTTQISQTATKIESTASAVTALEKRTATVEQTADGLTATVSKIRIGGTNLLKGTKLLETGETADDWRVSDNAKVSRYGNPSGFYRFMLTNSGQTADQWIAAGSPVARLPDGWRGKEVTLSAWIWSADWTAVDRGISWVLALSNGTSARQNYGRKDHIVVPGQVNLGGDAKSDTALANSKWVRVSTTFTLNTEDLPLGSGAFGENTHIFVQFYLVRNGDYRIYAPKLEFGNVATDWSPAPEDTDGAIAEVSAAVSVQAGEITANATKIEEVREDAAAAQGSADAVAERVTKVDQSISALDGKISDKVSVTDYNINNEAVNERFSLIEQDAETIALSVTGKLDKDASAAGLDTGSESQVQVTITKEKFAVDAPGEDGDFELNESGGRLPVLIAKRIEAPNVTPRYDGPAAVYVDPDATSAQIDAGNYFRSLSDALAKINAKWLPYTVTINMKAGMDEYGNLQARGFAGNGQLIINGNGAKLSGQLGVYLAGTPVTVDGLDMDVPANSYGYEAGFGSAYLTVRNCVITGRGSGWGVRSTQGANAIVTGCELYGLTRSLHVQYLGNLYGEGNKGDSVVAAASGGAMRLTGTQPCHQTAWTGYTATAGQIHTNGVTVDMGTATPPPAAAPTSREFFYTGSDSYAGGWNGFTDDDIRQGYNGSKRIFGCIWFDGAAIAGAVGTGAVKKASLRLHMRDGVGRGVAVSVQLWGTDKAYAGRTGEPALKKEYGTIGTTEPGEVNEITIPNEAVNDLIKGDIRALVLYSVDETLYNDRPYSRNYARFSGSTTATTDETKPRLTVVYQ